MTRNSGLVSMFVRADGDQLVEPSPPPGWVADWMFDGVVYLIAVPILVMLLLSLVQRWRHHWRYVDCSVGQRVLLWGPWVGACLALLSLVVWRLLAGDAPPAPLNSLAPVLFGALIVISGGIGVTFWRAFFHHAY